MYGSVIHQHNDMFMSCSWIGSEFPKAVIHEIFKNNCIGSALNDMHPKYFVLCYTCNQRKVECLTRSTCFILKGTMNAVIITLTVLLKVGMCLSQPLIIFFLIML